MGLCCCTRLSPVAACGGHSPLQCMGFSLRWLLPLQSTGSRCAGLSSCGPWAPERRLSSCGARAQPLRSMWDPPGPGLEPASPALAGGLPTTVPPGKPPPWCFDTFWKDAKLATPGTIAGFTNKYHSFFQRILLSCSLRKMLMYEPVRGLGLRPSQQYGGLRRVTEVCGSYARAVNCESQLWPPQ